MRKIERKILHVDVNSAFLSWTAVEMLKNGAEIDIRTIPAIIGGDEEKRKGIVLAKSIPAKKYGIQTAEPIYFAKQKCPNLQIYQSNFKTYYHYSDALYELLHEYTDKIERFSIDECFLDITDFLPRGRTDLEIAYEIHTRVKQELGFTVNVGVAPNKLLAKMASDFEKPDKVHTLYHNEISNKMWRSTSFGIINGRKKKSTKTRNIGNKNNWRFSTLSKRDFRKTIWKIWKNDLGVCKRNR